MLTSYPHNDKVATRGLRRGEHRFITVCFKVIPQELVADEFFLKLSLNVLYQALFRKKKQ